MFMSVWSNITGARLLSYSGIMGVLLLLLLLLVVVVVVVEVVLPILSSSLPTLVAPEMDCDADREELSPLLSPLLAPSLLSS